MKLIEHLPHEVYHGEKHVQSLQDALQEQIQKVQSARDDFLMQTRPETATWGLTLYEKEYGITPDVTKPNEQRLCRWRAKRQGQGTTTKQMISLMASSFSGGEVDVVEHIGQYLVEIKFVGTMGVPQNMKDLEQSLREVVPAHLDIGFTYRFLTFGQLTKQNITFGELSALGLTFPEFAGGAWTNGR